MNSSAQLSTQPVFGAVVVLKATVDGATVEATVDDITVGLTVGATVGGAVVGATVVGADVGADVAPGIKVTDTVGATPVVDTTAPTVDPGPLDAGLLGPVDEVDDAGTVEPVAADVATTAVGALVATDGELEPADAVIGARTGAVTGLGAAVRDGVPAFPVAGTGGTAAVGSENTTDAGAATGGVVEPAKGAP